MCIRDRGYTVAEQEANADGYVTTQTGESGTIPAGGTAEASFINRKDPPGGGIVKTGDGANPLLYAGLLAASLAGLTGMLVWGRRRKSTPPARNYPVFGTAHALSKQSPRRCV